MPSSAMFHFNETAWEKEGRAVLLAGLSGDVIEHNRECNCAGYGRYN
ncbi:MAG: hypothetical protein ABH832_02540 [bacterium]